MLDDSGSISYAKKAKKKKWKKKRKKKQKEESTCAKCKDDEICKVEHYPGGRTMTTCTPKSDVGTSVGDPGQVQSEL